MKTTGRRRFKLEAAGKGKQRKDVQGKICDLVDQFLSGIRIWHWRCPVGLVVLDSAECTREDDESKEEDPRKEFREAGVYYQGPPALKLPLAFSLASARISWFSRCRCGLWFPDFFRIRTLI